MSPGSSGMHQRWDNSDSGIGIEIKIDPFQAWWNRRHSKSKSKSNPPFSKYVKSKSESIKHKLYLNCIQIKSGFGFAHHCRQTVRNLHLCKFCHWSHIFDIWHPHDPVLRINNDLPLILHLIHLNVPKELPKLMDPWPNLLIALFILFSKRRIPSVIYDKRQYLQSQLMAIGYRGLIEYLCSGLNGFWMPNGIILVWALPASSLTWFLIHLAFVSLGTHSSFSLGFTYERQQLL